MLESHLVHSGTLTETEGADLYILAGHEASYWATKDVSPKVGIKFLSLGLDCWVNDEFYKGRNKSRNQFKDEETPDYSVLRIRLIRTCDSTRFVDFQMRFIKVN